MPILEYCSAVWCSAADTHLKLLHGPCRQGCQFLTGGVFEFDIGLRRSVAVLCMLYKIRCNPMHPLYGFLSLPFVPVRVKRGALVAHRYTYASPHYRTSQYPITFIPLSISLWNDLGDPVFDGVGLTDFKSGANACLLAIAALSLFVAYCFPFLSFYSMGWYILNCGTGVFGLMGC